MTTINMHIYALCFSVENLTAVAGMDCDELTISWFIEGDSIMLSQLNYTIALIMSGEEIQQSFNVSGSDCVDMNLQGVSCGDYLTIFYYIISGLQANQSFTVSLLTYADSTYAVSNLLLTTMANTTIPGMYIYKCQFIPVIV